MNYAFHPAAEAEHLEQVAFYESRQPGLGARYLAEVEAVLGRVCESPQQYAVEHSLGLRRAMLHRFPFTLIFRPSGLTVQVLAVAHHRRRPGYWGTRV